MQIDNKTMTLILSIFLYFYFYYITLKPFFREIYKSPIFQIKKKDKLSLYTPNQSHSMALWNKNKLNYDSKYGCDRISRKVHHL